MRLIVTSDTHRDFHSLRRLVEMHRASADIFIHLGDGAQELEQAIALYPDCKWLSVRGNCEFWDKRHAGGLLFLRTRENLLYPRPHVQRQIRP